MTQTKLQLNDSVIVKSYYVFPLCDLEVLDKSSPYYQPVKDYAVWFANR